MGLEENGGRKKNRKKSSTRHQSRKIRATSPKTEGTHISKMRQWDEGEEKRGQGRGGIVAKMQRTKQSVHMDKNHCLYLTESWEKQGNEARWHRRLKRGGGQ